MVQKGSGIADRAAAHIPHPYLDHAEFLCDEHGLPSDPDSQSSSRVNSAPKCSAPFRRIGIVIEPATVEQAHVARQAFHDFGEGRHPAGLNFGHCFVYALAKVTGEPLLFRGEDFRKTDITAAL